MTNLESLKSLYSDYHKDLYGFRPRGMSDEQWNSEEWLRAEIKHLDEVATSIYAKEAKQEQAAIDEFEKSVVEAIAFGAGDRESAIEWLMAAEGVAGDYKYFCHLNNLPYNYFDK